MVQADGAQLRLLRLPASEQHTACSANGRQQGNSSQLLRTRHASVRHAGTRHIERPP